MEATGAVVAQEPVAVGRRPGGIHDQMADVEVDAAVAVVVEPGGGLGAMGRKLTQRGAGSVIDPGQRRDLAEQRLPGQDDASVLYQEVLQQQVGRTVGLVLARDHPLRAIGIDVDVAVAVVVVVGEDRPRHVGGRELRHEIVGGLEGAVTEIAE